MLLHARHYATGKPIAVSIEHGRIAAIADSTQKPTQWISPAFFDPQINGCLGISFNSRSLTSEQVRTVADVCRGHGIGGFCPTLVTNSFDALRHGFAVLAKSVDMDRDLSRRMPRFHLEGPYLSGEDGPRGAHPKEYIRDPDWDEYQRLQDAADGRIGMVTVAPERAGALSFIEKLAASGVVVAIGHTAATGTQIRDAVKTGARTSTHLGNGSHAMLPRHDNYVWEQLANDDLWASIITDGHHLPATMVKCIVRVKGVSRLLITSDASSLAGKPSGKYREWGTDLEVLPSGKVVVSGTPFLAGSGHFTDLCATNVIRMAGVSLAEAIELTSAQPRRLLGLPVAKLEVGEPAGLMLFDWEPGGELKVREVI